MKKGFLCDLAAIQVEILREKNQIALNGAHDTPQHRSYATRNGVSVRENSPICVC